ncbi:MAG: hypothetical protein ACO3PY_06540, partial [Pontimonas sp.]
MGLAYNYAGLLLTETVTNGILDGWSVANGYDSMLRRTRVSLEKDTTEYQKASFGYDAGGRLGSVTDGLSTALKATYSYASNSPLLSSIAFTNNGTGQGMVTAKSHDDVNRLLSISSMPQGTSPPSQPIGFAYQLNAANQRIRSDREDGSSWQYQYDDLGQVISGHRYWADGSEIPGQQFEYAFDTIGNRIWAGGRASAEGVYANNRLNQLTIREVPGVVDVLGLANPTADVTVNGNVAGRSGEYFHHELAVSNSTNAQYPDITVLSLYGSQQSSTGKVFVAKHPESFSYDEDGNLTSDGRWTYTWDGENRLIEMKRDTDTPAGARQRLVFEYDYQGRRIHKQTYTYGSGWQEEQDIAFAYDGWNLLGELAINASNVASPLRTYLWGLDLSGSEQGAGGVGGLLKITDYTSGTTHHFVAYDGNGNVAGLVNSTHASVSARYEYGPFGEAIRATGPMAANNPIRFSSKYTDQESGLLYYGYR